MHEIAAGIWRWASRHPDWSPGAFGAEVGSYALVTKGELLLVDPLLPEEPAAVLAALDALAQGRETGVLITIGYHVRSAEQLAERYRAGIWGPADDLAPRLADAARLHDLAPGAVGPGGATAFALPHEEWPERPLWLPSHAAIVFGDALVTTPDGELRAWLQDEHEREDYNEQVLPAMRPLVLLGAERVLTTHGAPVLADGSRVLAATLAGEPWRFAG